MLLFIFQNIPSIEYKYGNGKGKGNDYIHSDGIKSPFPGKNFRN